MDENRAEFETFSQWHEQASAGLLTLHGLGLVDAACRCCHHTACSGWAWNPKKRARGRDVFSLMNYCRPSSIRRPMHMHWRSRTWTVPVLCCFGPSDVFGRGRSISWRRWWIENVWKRGGGTVAASGSALNSQKAKGFLNIHVNFSQNSANCLV